MLCYSLALPNLGPGTSLEYAGLFFADGRRWPQSRDCVAEWKPITCSRTLTPGDRQPKAGVAVVSLALVANGALADARQSTDGSKNDALPSRTPTSLGRFSRPNIRHQ
jgi:hypothetical protein